MSLGFFDRVSAKFDTWRDKCFGAPSQERLNQRLETAVRNGWVARAEKAVADGADIDATFPVRVAEGDKLSGHTPLAAAIVLNDAVLVDMLLLFNADTEARSASVGNPTALGTAVMAKDEAMMSRLLDAGASPEAQIETKIRIGTLATGGIYRYGPVPLVDYARKNAPSWIVDSLEEALKKLEPAGQGAAPVLVAPDVGKAFRENGRKGTTVPMTKPKTARFTKMKPPQM